MREVRWEGPTLAAADGGAPMGWRELEGAVREIGGEGAMPAFAGGGW